MLSRGDAIFMKAVSRTRRDGPDAVRNGSKLKKKPPTTSSPGDAGSHHRAVQRNRLRCTTSTSGVDQSPMDDVASTDFLQRGQRQESVFESVSSRENDCKHDARS